VCVCVCGAARAVADAQTTKRLTLAGVLKAAVLDGAEQLGLEEEVLEAAGVDAHARGLLGAARGRAAGAGRARGVGGRDLLLLVVEQLALDERRVGHCCCWWWCVSWLVWERERVGKERECGGGATRRTGRCRRGA
jgi:hypothetical protein